MEKPLAQTKKFNCTTWKILTQDYDNGLFMITLSLLSIQMVDGLIAPLGIHIAFSMLVFPWFFQLIQNNKQVVHLNIIYMT